MAYGFDMDERLVSETITEGGVEDAITYAYDGHGNITRRTDGGGAQDFAYDANDRLEQDGIWQYEWDDHGRLTRRTAAGVSEQFAYDGADRLVRVDRVGAGAQRIEMSYDYDGLIASRTADGVTTRFVWDRATGITPRLLELRDGAGALLQRFVYGEALLGRLLPDGSFQPAVREAGLLP